MRPEFTSSELATILASLRSFQELYVHDDEEETSDAVAANFPEHFADAMPLTSTEINELCEKINGR